MKTIKSQRIPLLTKVLDDPGGPKLVVSAFAFFPFEAPSALCTEVAMWKFATETLGPDVPVDLGAPKPRGEVLLTAKAFPFGRAARPACSVRVRIGTVDKTLYVVGNRRWGLTAATEPTPFTAMPISWANAFGGPGYAQNPLGKGYEPVKDDRGDHHPLPNVEDPKRLVATPRDRPAPAGLGPYDLTWPQRYAKLGTYDAAWLEERYPGYAADFDPTFFNTAPIDQQIEGFFRGDEAFVLEHLHPDKPVLEGRLPSVRARIFLNREANDIALQEVAMRAETVHLFPDAERGIVIFRGVVAVDDDDAADVRQLLAAFEALGEPKPVEHYRTVLAQRLDRKTGHLYVLRDRDLLPASLAAAPADADSAEMKGLLKSEGLLDANLRRRTEREVAAAHETARETMAAHGLEPPPLEPLPPKPPAPSLDELPTFVEQAEAELAAMRSASDEKFAAMEKLARTECEKSGIDYDAAVLAERAKSGGPPKFSAAAQMAELREQAARARSQGVVATDLEQKLADPAFEAKLVEAETTLRDGYRLFAHHMPSAARLEGDAATRTRASVIRARDAGERLFRWDLTGADLSHLDLRGADLRLAFLEAANLEGADLRGADLTMAVLTRANLSRAQLGGAKLVRANLGRANLTDADLAGTTDLTHAVLAHADLSRATFAGAKLTEADLGNAIFLETNFRGVSAEELTFLKSDLRGLVLAGADLKRCVFVETALDGVDFTKANLSGAVMVTITGAGCTFRGANLTGTQIVKESSLAGASFAGANLTRVLLRATNLVGADFSNATLTGADLSESDLTGANLERASARGARFMKANLTGANLRRADLMETILQRARLRGANFENANLFRADMLKVEVDTDTITKGANLKAIRFIQQKAPHGPR